MGMSLVDDLARRLGVANRHARTALVAQCAARVLPVYEEYWVGTYSGSVGRAVQIGWLVACGTPADSAEIRTCLAELEDVVSFYHEEGIGVLANATTVALRATRHSQRCSGWR